MTAKGILLFLLLLLSSGTSFSFPDPNPFWEQNDLNSEFEFEEETIDLYSGIAPSYKIPVLNVYPSFSEKGLFHRGFSEKLEQLDYIKCSRNIVPGLDVSGIIYPFHVFL